MHQWKVCVHVCVCVYSVSIDLCYTVQKVLQVLLWHLFILIEEEARGGKD